MIRPTRPEDTPELLALATGTEVFKPQEITALEEVLNDYHQFNQGEGHHAITFEQHGQIVGFAYFAPRAMTDRTWDLYWIAVTRQTQARGIGTRLLHHIEEAIRGLQGRLLLIETSSLPHYDLTRRFYLKHHYEQAAVIKDFYSDGDDLVIFRKRL